MKTEGIFIRDLQPEDVGVALELSSGEGWNQTARDWDFLIQSPDVVAIAAVNKSRVIATTTAIRYPGKVIWIGMVLVDKAFRGKGISKLLLNHVFQLSDEASVLKLDATAQGQRVYIPLGFQEEMQIVRMVHPVVSNQHLPVSEITPEPVDATHISAITALDKFTFGADRSSLINMLVTNYPESAWIVQKQQRIMGFTLGRAGSRYHHLGPVVAGCTSDAATLITHALNNLNGTAVVIDVLCDKQDLIASLISMGFSVQRYFSRMYRHQHNIPCNTADMFAIGGPEYG